MHIISPCVRSKQAHRQEIHILRTFLKGQSGHGDSREELQLSEPDRLGGGRGRVNPPPRRLVLEVWEVWRVWCLVTGSTHREARGLGGLLWKMDLARRYDCDAAALIVPNLR